MDFTMDRPEINVGTSINELKLPTGIKSCLEFEGIKTVEDLIQRSQGELLGIRRFGGVSLARVKKCLGEAGLSLSDSPSGIFPTHSRESRLREAIASGEVKNRGDASDYFGVSQDTIPKLMDRIGARFMPERWHTANKVIGEFNRGASYEQIAGELGLAKSTIRGYLSQAGLLNRVHKTKGRIGKLEKKAVDRLVRRGLNLKQIGGKAGVTRERIRQYVCKTGQSDAYKKSRLWYDNHKKINKRERNEKILSILMGVRKNAFDKLEDNERWVARMALKAGERHLYGFDKLSIVFKRYNDAQRCGKKLSLAELVAGTGIGNANAGKILKELGLGAMHGTFKRHPLPEDKKEAIRRVASLDMSYVDIGYFLGVSGAVVSQNIRRLGLNRTKSPSIFARVGHGIFGGASLTSRLASQIYEAQDLGFEEADICELLGVKGIVVNYALENRGEIGEEIMKGLKVMWPEKKIERPYL